MGESSKFEKQEEGRRIWVQWVEEVDLAEEDTRRSRCGAGDAAVHGIGREAWRTWFGQYQT